MCTSVRHVLIRLAMTLVAAIAAVVVFKADPAQAAAYIKFEGVDGESTDKDHKSWSDLASFGQGLNPAQAGASTRRRGDFIVKDVSVAKAIDASSPKLAQALCGGKSFPSVMIDLCTSSDPGDGRPEEQHCYMRYELENVLVSSYSVNGGGGDERATESLSLNFEEVKVTYTSQDPMQPPSETTLGDACAR